MNPEPSAQQTEPPSRKRKPRAVAQTNKRRGAMVERVVADYLAAHTGLPVERRRLEGVLDRGDLAGIRNAVVEIKSGQPHLAEWLRETERERVNAGARLGVLWWAPPGLAKTPDRHVVMVGFDQPGLIDDDYLYPPLHVPAGLIGWHVHAATTNCPTIIGGYTLHNYPAYATSGQHAATHWNWTDA